MFDFVPVVRLQTSTRFRGKCKDFLVNGYFHFFICRRIAAKSRFTWFKLFQMFKLFKADRLMFIFDFGLKATFEFPYFASVEGSDDSDENGTLPHTFPNKCICMLVLLLQFTYISSHSGSSLSLLFMLILFM